jgi:hypothetical protein
MKNKGYIENILNLHTVHMKVLMSPRIVLYEFPFKYLDMPHRKYTTF